MPGAPSALELTRLFRVMRGEDIESVLALYEPDAVWRPLWDHRAPKRGRDEIRSYWRRLVDEGLRTEAIIQAVQPVDERRVIVRGRLIQRRGRERSDRPACWLVEFGEAGVRSITGYDRVGEARAAARGDGDGDG